MAAKTGRYAILEQFLADDMTYMFGNPGTVEQGFLDTLEDYPKLTYIMGLQESVPVAMADAYARATKKPTLVQLHSSPGLGNGVGMMYQAMRGHAPLVIVAGDSGVQYDAMDAQMAADLVAIARPVTKWATRVLDSASLLRIVRRAIKIAATPPMGPVFVALPMDVLDAPTREDVVPTSIPRTRVAPPPEQISEVASILGAAVRPIIFIGDGIAYSGAQSELARVAELTGAEVWGVDSSEVNMSYSHPQFVGLTGHMFGEHSRPITSRADVILITGTYVFPEVFPEIGSVFAQGSKVIHIDLDAYEIAKNFSVDIGLVADPKTTLGLLAHELDREMTTRQKNAAQERSSALGAAKQREISAERAADLAVRDSVPLYASRFMSELAALLPSDAVIFDEALTNSPDLTRYIPPTTPGHFFQTRGGSLGVGVPGALGLKLANPDKTVIGFSGDGGSMYTIQALWTAAHHNIGAKFVICNNHSYRILKYNVQQYWRERHYQERDFPAPFSLHDPDIRFVDLAHGMGVQATRVEHPDQIVPAIEHALAHDGPYLIDLVLTDEVPAHFVYPKGGQ